MRKISIIAAMSTVALAMTGVMAVPAVAAEPALVTFTVTNGAGAPLRGAEVRISRDGGRIAQGTTGLDGTFAANAPAGTYQVTATSAQTGKTVTSPVIVAAGTVRAPAVTIPGIQIIAGTVRVDGAPAPEVDVSLGEYWRPHTTTAPDGTYSFELADPGAHTVLAETRPGAWTFVGDTIKREMATTVKVAADGAVTADINARTTFGTVKGTIVDHTGAPEPQALVRFIGQSRRLVTDGLSSGKDGTFERSLPQGRYVVEVDSTDGGATRNYSLSVAPGSTTRLDVILPKPDVGWLAAKITRPSTTKLSADISVFARKGEPAEAIGYRFDQFVAGTYLVVLDGTNISRRVTIKPGKTTTVRLARPRGTAIRGRVTAPNGKPAKMVNVKVLDSFGTSLGTTQTDKKGRYRLGGAVSGTYTIQTDRATPPRKIKVRKGKTATANIRLAKGATFSGLIATTSGERIPGVKVWAVGSHGSTAVARTDAHGRYEIRKVRTGRYRIVAADPDNAFLDGKSTHRVTAKAGKNTKVPTITLKEG